jgi:hypothetical protein
VQNWMKINIKSQEDMLLLFGLGMKITTYWKCKTTQQQPHQQQQLLLLLLQLQQKKKVIFILLFGDVMVMILSLEHPKTQTQSNL